MISKFCVTTIRLQSNSTFGINSSFTHVLLILLHLITGSAAQNVVNSSYSVQITIYLILYFYFTFVIVQPRGGGGSSIVKVPGDVPPARVYFFKLSSLAKGILLPILVHLVWARVCFLAISVKEMSNFANSCEETQIFSNIGPENGKIWQVLYRKCQLMALLM